MKSVELRSSAHGCGCLWGRGVAIWRICETCNCVLHSVGFLRRGRASGLHWLPMCVPLCSLFISRSSCLGPGVHVHVHVPVSPA